MVEKAPFSEIFSQAWRASSPRGMALSFGTLVACGVAAEQFAAQALLHPSNEGVAAALQNLWPGYAVPMLAIVLAVAAAKVFGQANLIAALSTRKGEYFRMADMIARFFRAFAMDAMTLAVLAVLMGVFATPPLFAFFNNRGAFDGTIVLSILAFFPALFMVLFIRLYSLFYFLLSPLRFRSSIDRGAALFSKYILRSFLFWVFSLAIGGAFTFLLNVAMLGTSSLFSAAGLIAFSVPAAYAVGFAGLVWYSIFDQALLLRFFEDLASEKDREDAVSGEQVLDPGMPVA